MRNRSRTSSPSAISAGMSSTLRAPGTGGAPSASGLLLLLLPHPATPPPAPHPHPAADIPPRIPRSVVSGRRGNDLAATPNPVNRDTDSTHQPSPATPPWITCYHSIDYSHHNTRRRYHVDSARAEVWKSPFASANCKRSRQLLLARERVFFSPRVRERESIPGAEFQPGDIVTISPPSSFATRARQRRRRGGEGRGGGGGERKKKRGKKARGRGGGGGGGGGGKREKGGGKKRRISRAERKRDGGVSA